MSGHRLRFRRRRWSRANGRPSLELSLEIWLGKFCRGLTVLSSAVLVGVVAAEEHIGLVAFDDLGEPAYGLASWSIAEVLLIDRRRVTPAKDMVAGLPAESDGLVKTVSDILVLSSIAGGVDGILVNRSSVPGAASSSGRVSSDSDGGGLAGNKRRGRDSHRSEEHKRCEASHCGEQWSD